MLRTITPSEPELVRLCRSRQWVNVSVRSRSHPTEAVPSESAVCGEGTTALAIAVRSGAPLGVIQALLEADIHQLGIVRQQQGTILHEAIKHRVAGDVLEYMVNSMIRYQRAADQSRFNCNAPFPRLFGINDELGRTRLHYMVERIKRELEEEGGDISNSWAIFRNIIQEHPDSIQVMDSDGNTPLILILLVPKSLLGEEATLRMEMEVYRVVHLMVSTCPSAATIPRKLPRPWRFLNKNEEGSNSKLHGAGGGSPTPLYYAILYGRAIPTVDALLDANRKMGIDGCAMIVSPYHEVPLHVAITTRASLPLLSKLIGFSPNSTVVCDLYGLTPLDWTWIRHVMDWYQPASLLPPASRFLVSRGRYLGSNFLERHKDVSRWLITTMPAANGIHETVKLAKKDLLQRIRVLLPTMAATVAATAMCKHYPHHHDHHHDHHHHSQDVVGTSWSLLHAACYLPCPSAMVHLALEDHSELHAVHTKDGSLGRLPLHYAADRLGGYTANFPVGVSPRGTQRFTEPSCVPELTSWYAGGCRVEDRYGQLPLHVAIDAAKRCRATGVLSNNMMLQEAEVDTMEMEVLTALASSYPESLERRDGKTLLYPFQQAAVGPGACVNSIYFLLRQSPTLVLS